jgi:hypothetical protein
MIDNRNRRFCCYDLPKNEWPDWANRTRDGGRKRSGKAAKKASDRFMRNEWKKELHDFLMEVA